MITTQAECLAFLDRSQIPYQCSQHPPVYTCEQADQYRPRLNGVSTKNLFLRGRREHHYYLVMTDCAKRTDLKSLGKELGDSKLHFGSEEKLHELLGLTPGSVTVLGLVNDVDHQVELIVDAEIWDAEDFLCHPLVNTATLVLSKAGLSAFFGLTGHVPRVVEVPSP